MLRSLGGGLLVALFFVGNSLPAVGLEDSIPGRVAAAQQYVHTAELERILLEGALAHAPTPEVRLFLQRFFESNWQNMEEDIIDLIARTYTVAEINAMNAFYSTEVGKSILLKSMIINTGIEKIMEKYRTKVVHEACKKDCSCIKKYLADYRC